MNKTIEAVREAYVAFSRGSVELAPVAHLDVSKHNGEVDIKSGYVEDFGLIGTKIASGFYDNQKMALPPGVAIIVLMDLKTSMPLAVMDGTYITAYRTGAAGAVAASLLARKGSVNVGIVGAGTQARMQALALNEVFSLEKIRVWDIVDKAGRNYANEMSERLGIDVKAKDKVESVVRGADIVVTVTPSREALVDADWIEEGIHINAIGADSTGKQELDPMVVKKAGKIVVDSLTQCRRIGEIQHALSLGLITEADVHAEIGQILVGEKVGRETEDEITLFDSTGIAAQDIAAAHVVLEEAKSKDLGRLINLLDI
jgi:ornithine cyclodeaminase/alanine dehydrogenase